MATASTRAGHCDAVSVEARSRFALGWSRPAVQARYGWAELLLMAGSARRNVTSNAIRSQTWLADFWT